MHLHIQGLFSFNVSAILHLYYNDSYITTYHVTTSESTQNSCHAGQQVSSALENLSIILYVFSPVICTNHAHELQRIVAHD